ncbi:MAG: aminotransferase class I/II-fold pyridoxal phosphate-dependent enzyme [Frankiaceae bacterium]|nr:aminotransferase class I/II-fold pyridoxal phosphate-dependent enzyme [Frankiaceae bacterium]
MTLAIDGGTPVRTAPLPVGKGAELLGAQEREAVLRVLDSGALFRYYGPVPPREVAAFEEEVAALHGPGVRAVAVSSGTAALRTSLAALGIGPGDEVVVPACTFVASVNAVVLSGALPVFAEVDETLGLSADAVRAVLSPRTAAVMPVHLDNGQVDMAALLQVTRPAGVAVLEDTAQSMGATLHGCRLGTIGDMGALSMQLDKNVTTGEGGVVITRDRDLALRAAAFQDQGGHFLTQHGAGRDHAPEPFCGDNLRLTELQGAIGRVQLGRLDGLLDQMRAAKARITSAIGPLPGTTPRRYPDPVGEGGSGIGMFFDDAATAQRFAAALCAEGVPAGSPYGGLPVYATPAVLQQRTASRKGHPFDCAEHPAPAYAMGMCPQTEDLLARCVRIGVSPAYTDADCDDVVDAVGKVADAMLR